MSRLLFIGLLPATLALCSSPPLPAPLIQVRDIQIPKIDRPPNIEEFLDGGSRGDMKRIDDFRQRNPGDGVPVSQNTSAWIGYSDKSFYAVFVCHAPAGQAEVF